DQLLATVVVAAAAAAAAPIVTPPTIAAAAIAATPSSAATRTARTAARVLGRRSFGRSLRSLSFGLRRSFGDCGLGRLGSGLVGLLVLVLHLKLQSAFAGSVGEGLDPAMEQEG